MIQFLSSSYQSATSKISDLFSFSFSPLTVKVSCVGEKIFSNLKKVVTEKQTAFISTASYLSSLLGAKEETTSERSLRFQKVWEQRQSVTCGQIPAIATTASPSFQIVATDDLFSVLRQPKDLKNSPLPGAAPSLPSSPFWQNFVQQKQQAAAMSFSPLESTFPEEEEENAPLPLDPAKILPGQEEEGFFSLDQRGYELVRSSLAAQLDVLAKQALLGAKEETTSERSLRFQKVWEQRQSVLCGQIPAIATTASPSFERVAADDLFSLLRQPKDLKNSPLPGAAPSLPPSPFWQNFVQQKKQAAAMAFSPLESTFPEE